MDPKTATLCPFRLPRDPGLRAYQLGWTRTENTKDLDPEIWVLIIYSWLAKRESANINNCAAERPAGLREQACNKM